MNFFPDISAIQQGIAQAMLRLLMNRIAFGLIILSVIVSPVGVAMSNGNDTASVLIAVVPYVIIASIILFLAGEIYLEKMSSPVWKKQSYLPGIYKTTAETSLRTWLNDFFWICEIKYAAGLIKPLRQAFRKFYNRIHGCLFVQIPENLDQ